MNSYLEEETTTDAAGEGSYTGMWARPHAIFWVDPILKIWIQRKHDIGDSFPDCSAILSDLHIHSVGHASHVIGGRKPYFLILSDTVVVFQN